MSTHGAQLLRMVYTILRALSLVVLLGLQALLHAPLLLLALCM